MDRRQFLRRSAVAVGGTGVLAGCISDDPTSTPAGEVDASIEMTTAGDSYYFNPVGLFVESGTTVRWGLVDGSHSTTAYADGNGPAETRRIPEGAEAWNSDILGEVGATFEHTFETAGTYDYFCVPHKSLGMVGRIVVDEPGGPAEGSMPPDGDVPESSTIVDQGDVSHSEFTG